MRELENLIEIRNVSFSYDTLPVLENINLDIPKGDYLAIVGPNGAGKTTLLKIILNLLQPRTGEIKLFGENIKKFKNWPKIGYVPQQTSNFDKNFPATVMEIILTGRYGKIGLFKNISGKDREAAERVLGKLNMWTQKDKLIGNLSGGELQRVFIARALVSDPEIIFLDEPAVSIDPKTREEFYGLLKMMNEEMNLTVVLISHDVEMVLREAKHIVCVNKNLMCHSLPEEFVKNTRLTDIFGGEIKIITHAHDHKNHAGHS